MNYHFSRLILKLNIDVSLTGIHMLGQCRQALVVWVELINDK